jgi:succinate-semialdehyde dehydrogenase/glutarate-semialdehyde dehydrogenase
MLLRAATQEDAFVDQAVDAAVASKFRNAGQTCVCSDRFLLHESVHDIFVEKLRQKVEDFVVGSGMDASTTMGPLITADAVANVAQKVKEAIAEGATCVTGGFPLDDAGSNFYAPTILTNVDRNSRIWSTETFGPVAAIRSFATEEEALEIANDARVGLASYFCTRDLSRVFRFSKRYVSIVRLVGIYKVQF